jgi:4-aminobutyrate aminotransferase-like enzyme/Ser/Thr protein kinase RdoA (MazF antagonist)
MPTFNFLAQPSLPRPRVTIEDAERIARESFGISGTVTELGSNQDRNFQVTVDEARYVLRISNPAFSATELAAQDAAMAHLQHAGLDVPRSVEGLDGMLHQPVELHHQTLIARLLTFVEGESLAADDVLSPDQVRALGDTSARIVAGLADFAHPGTERVTQWDLRVASEVIDTLIDHVASAGRRAVVRAAGEHASARLDPVRDGLRIQAIHSDLTDDNVVRADGAGTVEVTGVIDFGDIGQGWLVGELAATCASVLHHNHAHPLDVLEAIAAFTERVPLTDQEIAALWPLVVLRTAVLVVSGEQQVALDGDNEYADENRRSEWLAFDTATRLDFDEMEALIAWRVRTADSPGADPIGEYALVAELPAAAQLDLSVTSLAFEGGSWLDPGIESRLAGAMYDMLGAAVTRYGEYRLSRAVLDVAGEVATLAIGAEIYLSPGTPVVAPVDGEIRSADGAVVLVAAGYDVWLTGLDRASRGDEIVIAGQVIGTVAPWHDFAVSGSDETDVPATTDVARMTLQVSRARGIRPPFFVRPSAEALWRRVCPDPSGLLGIPAAAAEWATDALLHLREATFARVQEHYYEHPPQIERGWRHHLIDVRAQTYVDMVNNVSAVGHAHPRLVEAVADQWSLLNTNSRFHYAQLARFSSRLAALAPEPLDTVFLVNSGSEAVDLAIRLAQAYTGQSTVLAVREAYHGWTMGADAVSSSIGDNPRALETRPDWVHLVESPHSYRGKHRGADSGARYVADFAVDLRMLDEQGRGIAGFIAEPVFGNAGGVLLPDGYLEGTYAEVRRRGGLCIADEVQVGYGRLGEYFWGSTQQGVVPDIITVAKAMGNGHPLGAVITRRDIAERFANEGSMFSSAGGSPVSCRVGLTVLDIMADESLQENASVVGAHLKSRLEDLGERFELIGAVYGLGLYLGVELVLDRTTLEPATSVAARVCDALLTEGCIMQPTGDYKNVLKIKPPLCLTIESADFFADALERVLSREVAR